MSWSIQLTLFALLFSLTAFYALFYPLSLYFPDLIESWFTVLPSMIYWIDGEFPFLLNALIFIAAVVIAPVLEEFVFRGLLLRRWSEKWNTKTAIIVSSLIFGLLHGNPFGAFAFGVAMCFIYLKSGSLWLSIICHAFNNFLAWLLSVIYVVIYEPEYTYDVSVFQSEWPFAAVSGLIIIIWAIIYIKSNKPIQKLF